MAISSLEKACAISTVQAHILEPWFDCELGINELGVWLVKGRVPNLVIASLKLGELNRSSLPQPFEPSSLSNLGFDSPSSRLMILGLGWPKAANPT
ncbi:hypothetical protein CDL15_Pgr017258 [Punica granatum]|nr:hypothetical protein CDL15_Pgr017258 [Punica granatum]